MRTLDIQNIGRIGQMFIDGDLLQNVMADPLTCDEDDTNYNIPVFNTLKKVLMKIERMNPDIYYSGIIWLWYPANKRMVIPAVVGRHLSADFSAGPWLINNAPPEMAEAMQSNKNTAAAGSHGHKTYYFPIATAAGDVVGVLDLTERERPQFFEANYTERG